MGECLDWHLLKAAHKALYDEHWPTNLRLEDVQHGRRLHSNITINPKIPLKSDTFQDCVTKQTNEPQNYTNLINKSLYQMIKL